MIKAFSRAKHLLPLVWDAWLKYFLVERMRISKLQTAHYSTYSHSARSWLAHSHHHPPHSS